MKFNIDKKLPITPQVYNQICLMIIKEKLQSNHKLLSVRDLAIKIGVNPNTIQKSYELLEESKVIYSIRGSGWYVANDTTIASKIVDDLISKKVNDFVIEMNKLGIDKNTLIKLIDKGDEKDE
ncbi:MAG: GntR family transcriptional regulator [Erysipelotrichaceae bacterium]|nr:GntR family transcriptional regulator [Erysipelotrichaceae bacterium]